MDVSLVARVENRDERFALILQSYVLVCPLIVAVASTCDYLWLYIYTALHYMASGTVIVVALVLPSATAANREDRPWNCALVLLFLCVLSYVI